MKTSLVSIDGVEQVIRTELQFRGQLQGVTWQQCQTHVMRNVLDASPKALKDEIHTHVRAILETPNPDAARLLLQQTLAAYEDKAAKAMRILEDGFDDVTTVLSLPETCHSHIPEPRVRHSTDRCLLMKQDEKWTSGKKYLDMREYLEWRESQSKSVSKVTRIM